MRQHPSVSSVLMQHVEIIREEPPSRNEGVFVCLLGVLGGNGENRYLMCLEFIYLFYFIYDYFFEVMNFSTLNGNISEKKLETKW